MAGTEDSIPAAPAELATATAAAAKMRATDSMEDSQAVEGQPRRLRRPGGILVTYTQQAVPEPSTIPLLSAVAIGLLAMASFSVGAKRPLTRRAIASQ